VQNLARAIGTTAGYLTKSCPQNIPAQPVARLEMMQSQMQTLTMALDIVRPPLQQLEQSLSLAQKARFAAVPPDAAAACGTAPAATDWSIDDIDQSVQPDQSQRLALADLKEAFASVAVDLHAHCPQPLPASPLARLEAIEAQLDASWRASLSMRVALATFESTLNDEQRSRFDTMTVAQTQ
jgi:LTXXQ motif family protein